MNEQKNERHRIWNEEAVFKPKESLPVVIISSNSKFKIFGILREILGPVLPVISLNLSHVSDKQLSMEGERMQRKCTSSFSYLQVPTTKMS